MYISLNSTKITKTNDKNKEQKDESKEEIKEFRKRKYKKYSKMKRLFAQSTKIAIYSQDLITQKERTKRLLKKKP